MVTKELSFFTNSFRDHSLSTYGKFSKKLALSCRHTCAYQRAQNVSFFEGSKSASMAWLNLYPSYYSSNNKTESYSLNV